MPSMTLNDGKVLDNILSVSTAASNKFLFHFNSFNSLTQWTAGIRLAVYEHTTLQEAYTGALIAGKGKQLNNIRVILDRQRARHEDWARVRFGAGTPWRRCWCVVTPPDEKEFAKLQKTHRKENVYDRSPVILKGDMKFYDSKKITKKTKPIATVREAYSCYAIYPQSKPLIDQSTLVKIEGKITIHSNPESVTEGFVFVMPETHPAVSGFEIMLRFLFPVYDTFALYGRPNKLIADVLDTRGLMFAMPPDRRYGYLEMWDVVSLIHSDGSHDWSERQWRRQLKELTSKRMLAAPVRNSSKVSGRRNTVSRISLPPSRNGTIRFDEGGSIRSQPSTRQPSPTRVEDLEPQKQRRTDSAPPSAMAFATSRHQRSVSEANGYNRYQSEDPSRLARGTNAEAYDNPPTPPEHLIMDSAAQQQDSYDTASDEAPSPVTQDLPVVQVATAPPVGPVASPPSFAHAPSQKPPVRPYLPSQKPSTQLDPATLYQLADATHATLPAGVAAAGAAATWKSQESLSSRRNGDYDGNQRHLSANGHGNSADQYNSNMNGSYSGHSGSRLPTIPASPYVEHSEFVDQPTVYMPMAPPVPEHVEMPEPQSMQELAHRQRPSSGDSQVQRKPVPGRSSQSSREEYDNRSTKSSSLGSLRNDVIDPEALDSLNYTETSLFRQVSMSSSRYDDDDAASTSTPDYASTISEEPRLRKLPDRREDRPRSGFLKTIGNPDLNPKSDAVVGDAHYNPAHVQGDPTTNIPTIDFGPTYSLAPEAKRPGTSGTLIPDAMNNSSSRPTENLVPFLGEEKRTSSYSGRTTPIAAMHMRSSSASPQFPDTRSVAWQPAMASQTHSDKQRLDPDDWVAHRAWAAYQPRPSPVNAHGRSKSHTPPPLIRAQSGDWAHLQRTPEAMPARPPSRPLSRPLSRGAGGLLDQLPTSLSAREQEQVARMTGTPLIDLKHNNKKARELPAAGLTAYIDQREKEKAKAKTHQGTPAMQAEIDRRMMAAQQRQMMEMQQQQMGQQIAMAQGGYGTPPLMGNPPAYPQTLAFSNPAQMQQMYQQPQAYMPQAFPMATPHPPGAWPTPTPQQMQSQQYFPQQQPPPQQPYVQPYGASYDQAQAAARYAHQQGQQRRG
jgi:CCR4-NOT transcriptional complex subunit CAF120